MTEIKYCEDCKWCNPHALQPMCMHPELQDGRIYVRREAKPSTYQCSVCRELYDLCGLGAKHFEAK